MDGSCEVVTYPCCAQWDVYLRSAYDRVVSDGTASPRRATMACAAADETAEGATKQKRAVMEEGGFTVVSRRGTARQARQSIGPVPPSVSVATKGFRYKATHLHMADNMPKELAGRVDEAVREVERSSVWPCILNLLLSADLAQELVCYGIGNFSTSPAAKYQVALAMLLRKALAKTYTKDRDANSNGRHIDGLSLRATMYDPVFSMLEIEFLVARGFNVPAENEEGRRTIDRKTLFFMPHCGRQLYSNVIGANWNAASLPLLVVLGNSFSAYADSLPTQRREDACKWCHLFRAADFVVEQACGEQTARKSAFSNAFNNLSLHSFDSKLIPPDAMMQVFEPVPLDDPSAHLDIIPATASPHLHDDTELHIVLEKQAGVANVDEFLPAMQWPVRSEGGVEESYLQRVESALHYSLAWPALRSCSACRRN
eukprot:4246944-Pleurochrysis_carterae.AAC.1